VTRNTPAIIGAHDGRNFYPGSGPMKYLPIVLRNILRNRRRTVLTVLSVAVSVFVFAALMSLPTVVDRILRDRANSLRLITHSKAGFFYNLPGAYRNQIAAIPHVEAVCGEMIFMGTYRSVRDLVPSAAIDPEKVAEIWPDWRISKEAAQQFRRVRTGALAGSALMKRYGWKIGDHVILRGTIYPVDAELTIAGTLNGQAPAGALLFRLDHLDELLGRPGTVNLIWSKIDRSESIPGVVAEIDERFSNSSAETITETELGASLAQLGSMRVIFDGARILAAIVMLAIALVAANTAAMSVRERRKEIAVMRAIGFGRAVIVNCLLAEGLAIGVASGLLGCAAAYFGLKLAPRASSSLGVLALLISPPARVLVESFLIAAAIGLASSLAPGIAAVRREVVSELRAVV
jgi:putative ABC transport system permease protein